MNNMWLYGLYTWPSLPMGVHHVHLPYNVYGTYCFGDRADNRGAPNFVKLAKNICQASINNMWIYGVYTRPSLSIVVHHVHSPSDVYGSYRYPSLVKGPISCGDHPDNRSIQNFVKLSRYIGQAFVNIVWIYGICTRSSLSMRVHHVHPTSDV